MMRVRKWMVAAWMGMALLLGNGVSMAAVPQEQTERPPYTMAEYNAYQAAHNEQNPQQKVALLDQFVAEYGNSALLQYIYRDYYLAYYALEDYPKTIEYVDQLLALLGNNIDRGTKLEALVARAQAYFAGSSNPELQTPDALQKTAAAAQEGLSTLAQWQKPENMTDEQFSTQQQRIGLLLNSVAGIAQSQLKDYRAAAASYEAALALDPDDAVTHYRLGVAYLQQTPPQELPGFWELARSIALGGPGEAQVRSYLRNQILNYQQPACDQLVDDQVDELITLAMSSAERPASLVIPSADDLERARQDVTNFLPALRNGGEEGKVMWLATCGLEYPDVPVRVMAVEPGEGDSTTLRVFRAATQEEMEAATEPNMEVHVTGQPEVRQLAEDDYVRFTGTLSGYQQTPFLLTWESARVNPEDIIPPQ